MKVKELMSLQELCAFFQTFEGVMYLALGAIVIGVIVCAIVAIHNHIVMTARQKFNYVIGGQAVSHCVNASINEMMQRYGGRSL